MRGQPHKGAQSPPASTQQEQASPRVRFAKREIERALRALEALERNPNLDYAIRCFQLEDQVEDERQQAREWRQKYESLKSLLAAGKQ